MVLMDISNDIRTSQDVVFVRPRIVGQEELVTNRNQSEPLIEESHAGPPADDVVKEDHPVVEIPLRWSPRNVSVLMELSTFLGVTDIVDIKDPGMYKEAMKSPNTKDWEEVVQRELTSISATGMWTDVVLPQGANIVGSRWVFKAKRDSMGNVVKYKAGIVAKGFM